MNFIKVKRGILNRLVNKRIQEPSLENVSIERYNRVKEEHDNKSKMRNPLATN